MKITFRSASRKPARTHRSIDASRVSSRMLSRNPQSPRHCKTPPRASGPILLAQSSQPAVPPHLKPGFRQVLSNFAIAHNPYFVGRGKICLRKLGRGFPTQRDKPSLDSVESEKPKSPPHMSINILTNIPAVLWVRAKSKYYFTIKLRRDRENPSSTEPVAFREPVSYSCLGEELAVQRGKMAHGSRRRGRPPPSQDVSSSP